MENTNVDFNSLLDNIKSSSQLSQALASENAPSELKDELSYDVLQKLIGYIEDESPAKRIYWFLNLLDEKYEQERQPGKKREKLNLQDYIESMLDKIGSEQYYWNIAELIEKLKGYDLTNYVEKILSKIADNQKSKDMKKIAQSLKECEKVAQNFSNYIELILNKLKNSQSGPDFDDMAKLITEFKDCKLEKNHVDKILSKIEDNQNADDMAKLVKSLRECGVKVEEYIGSILDKLADGQPGNHATWNPMAELVQEFKDCKLEKNHVEKILSKIADKQNADDMAKLVKSLRECDVKVEKYIKSILDRCKDKQSAGDMAKLITEFKDCKLEKNHVEEILSKIADKQSASDMAKLVKSLRECSVKVEEYIGSILGKLADGQFAGGSSWFGSMAKLIKEFKDCKLMDDHVKKILAKTKDKASAGDMTELVKSLRECNVKVEDYIGSISDRLANDQSAGDMTELVKSLKTCGVQVEKYIGSISNKLAGDQSAGDITKLITEFKDCNLSKKDIKPIIEKIARKQFANDMLYLAQYLKDQKYDINGIMIYIVNRIKEDAEPNMDLIAELIDLVVNSNNNTEEQYFRASLAKMKYYKSIDKLVALVEKLSNTALGNQAFGDAFNIVLDQILEDRPNYSNLLVGIISLITLLASKNCKNNKFYKSLLDKLAQINPKVEESYSITNLTTIVNKLSSSESFECIEQVFIEKLTSVNLKTLTQEIMGKNKNNFGSYINDAIKEIALLINELISKKINDEDIYTSVLNLFTDIEYESDNKGEKVVHVHVIDSIIKLVEQLTKDNLNFIKQYFKSKLEKLQFVSIEFINALIQALAKKDITLVSDVFGIILNKLSNNLSAQSVTSLIEALRQNEVVLKDEQVEIILNKLSKDLSAESMTSLIKALTQNEVVLNNEQVEIILNKLDQESTTNSVLDFINELKENHQDIKLDSNVYAKIFGSLEKNLSKKDVLDFIKELKDNHQDIKLDSNVYAAIFGSLEKNLSKKDVLDFIKELKDNHQDIKLDNNVYAAIFGSLKKNLSTQNVLGFIEELKETHKDIKLDSNVYAAIFGSLEENLSTQNVLEFIKNNNDIEWNNNVYAAIFGSLEKNLSKKDVLDFIKELKENNNDIKWNSNVYAAIFGSLKESLSKKDVLDFIKELKQNNKDIKWNSNVYAAIFGSLEKNLSKKDVLDFIKELKQNNNDIKWNSNVYAAIFGSLKESLSKKDVLDFIKELKQKYNDIEWNSNVYAAIFGSLEESDVDSILNLIQGLTMMDIQLKNKYIKIFLDKLPNDLNLDGVIDCIVPLTAKNIKLTDKHIERILDKLAEGLSLGDVIKFISTLTAKNIKLTDKHIERILDKLKKGFSLDSVIKFISILAKDNIELTKEHIEIILDKLQKGLSLDGVIKFISTLTENNIKLTDGHVKIILGKLVELEEKKQLANTNPLIELTDKLTGNSVALDRNDVTMMLNQLHSGYVRAKDRNANKGLISLLEKLKENNKYLIFNDQELANILYQKLQRADGEEAALKQYLNGVPKQEKLIGKKTENTFNTKIDLIKIDLNNPEEINTDGINIINNKSNINNIIANGKSNNHNDNRFIKDNNTISGKKSSQNKTENTNYGNGRIGESYFASLDSHKDKQLNINTVKNKIIDNNIQENESQFPNLVQLLTNVKNGQDINDDKIRTLENENDQKEFKSDVAKQLSIQLNSLVKSYEDTNESWQDFQNKLDVEKEFWKNIGNGLCQTKLLAPEEAKAFTNKINDIYDVNWLATAFQWIGCVLGSLVTLGGLLFWDKVRNRISHPEITRQYYRFKDDKDELLSKIAPLQEIDDQKIKNDDKI